MINQRKPLSIKKNLLCYSHKRKSKSRKKKLAKPMRRVAIWKTNPLILIELKDHLYTISRNTLLRPSEKLLSLYGLMNLLGISNWLKACGMSLKNHRKTLNNLCH
jgi:hypothetical protein